MKYIPRTVTLPESTDKEVERAVEIQFGGNRSKAYSELLMKALGVEEEKERLDTLEAKLNRVVKSLRDKGIEI